MEQLNPSERLVKYGFIKKGEMENYFFDEKKGHWKAKQGSLNGSQADEEALEIVNELGPATGSSKDAHPFSKTGYPKSVKAYHLVLEAFNLSMEETYFWILTHLRQDLAYSSVTKLIDSFSAAENSSFWGQSSQRLGIQQDKASQFMKGVSELIRQLFQIVRELRIIDERLELYKEWHPAKNDPKYKKDNPRKGSKSADTTLKSLYVELVEGGAEKINSVYGLARQVGYTILPDLFFNTRIYKLDDLDRTVDALDFNPNVKNVLRKKLFAFLVWEEKTYKELASRRRYMIHYVRQHWATIKMYTNWVRPYLRSVGRLSMKEKYITSPDIITAFETAVTEIEILATKEPTDGYYPVVIANFMFTTKPLMNYSQPDTYQARGALHVGKVEITLRSYAWTKQQIENFKKIREHEDMELMGIVDSSVAAAMEALGDDLDKYLQEAGEDVEKKKEEEMAFKPKTNGGAFEPFVALFKGFGDLFTAMIPIPERKPKDHSNPKHAEGHAMGSIFTVYKNYKKAHGMLSW